MLVHMTAEALIILSKQGLRWWNRIGLQSSWFSRCRLNNVSFRFYANWDYAEHNFKKRCKVTKKTVISKVIEGKNLFFIDIYLSYVDVLLFFWDSGNIKKHQKYWQFLSWREICFSFRKVQKRVFGWLETLFCFLFGFFFFVESMLWQF